MIKQAIMESCILFSNLINSSCGYRCTCQRSAGICGSECLTSAWVWPGVVRSRWHVPLFAFLLCFLSPTHVVFFFLISVMCFMMSSKGDPLSTSRWTSKSSKPRLQKYGISFQFKMTSKPVCWEELMCCWATLLWRLLLASPLHTRRRVQALGIKWQEMNKFTWEHTLNIHPEIIQNEWAQVT